MKEISINPNKIPKSISMPKNIDIKISEIKGEKNYTIYKYVPIEKIDILLTNAHRIDDPAKKIEKLNTISFYLDKNNKEEYITLSNILKNTSESDIELIEIEQKAFEKKLPTTVKYPKDYLWQIYYIERTNRYYMIVPTEETEQQAFIYLLKKKLNGNKGKIYVPICNGIHENTYIEHSKLKKIESILYAFTNNWPSIYEYTNKKDETIISIIGLTNVYESIISSYKMEYKNSRDINSFYQLIDTLFYLQTELGHFFNFEKYIDTKAFLHFYYNNMEINNDNLSDFYKEEIDKNIKSIYEVDNMQISLNSKLNNLKNEESKLNSELLYKQKQIAIFLECKKTFFGKVKYFFKYNKKKNKMVFEGKTYENKEDTINAKSENIAYNYNISDLVYICKQLKTKTIAAATIRMEIQNLTVKIDVLKKKIENANLYIKEIGDHQKSIFDFWKYTNKDEKAQLTEANTLQEQSKSVIKSIFNINEDLKKFGSKIDLEQRNSLSEEEKNSILLTNTIILDDINNIANLGKTTSEVFEKIHQNSNLINIKELNVTHREKIKNISDIISSNVTFEEYVSIIKNSITNIENALKKIKTDRDIPAYFLEEPNNKVLRLELDPKKIVEKNNEINLYKINLKKDMHIIAFSNIIFYNNWNKTLPLGMDYSTEILVDLRNIDIIKIKNTSNNIVDLNNNKVTKLNIIEFNC